MIAHLHIEYLSSADILMAGLLQFFVSQWKCVCIRTSWISLNRRGTPLGNTWTSPQSVSSLSNTHTHRITTSDHNTADRPCLETLSFCFFRFRLKSRLGVDSSLTHSLYSYRLPTLPCSLLPCICVSSFALFLPTTFFSVLIPALNQGKPWLPPRWLLLSANEKAREKERETHNAGPKVYKKLAA